MLDSQDILINARDGTCPDDRFTPGIGDALATLFNWMGIPALIARLVHRPCGCKARQAKMNDRWRGLGQWLAGFQPSRL